MPQLSVIVPVYNALHTVEECLNSLLRQDFSDFELILADDGSTDGAANLLEHFAARDRRVRLLRRGCNRGVSFTRNEGIRAARGEWIMFADADDLALPGYLELPLRTARDTGCELVFCGWHEEKGSRIPPALELADWRGHAGIMAEAFAQGLLNPCFGKLYRRDKIAQNFNETLSLGEDLLFNLDYLRGIRRAAFIPRALYAHQTHKNSLSRLYRSDLAEISLLLGQESLAFFRQSFPQGFDEALVLRPLAAGFRRNAGKIAAEASLTRAEKLALLHAMLQEPEFRRALKEADPGGASFALFHRLALCGGCRAVYAALRLRGAVRKVRGKGKTLGRRTKSG